jgi:regulator of ribonuclease activity A
MNAIPTCDLCDAHKAEAGAALRVLPPLFNSYGGVQRFAGPVATAACFEDNTVVKAAVESPGHGCVLVVDGGGSLRRALVGGNLAASAAKNGWAGVVVFGAVRDVAELRATAVGVCALGLVPIAGERRGAGQRDVPVQIAGIRVEPGDWLIADEDGLVLLSPTLAAVHGWGAAPGG